MIPKLDLQLFADDNPPSGGDEIEKLKAEYQAEIEKQKKEKDKYAKELAEIKKANKEKLTEEEQEKLKREEQDKIFAETKKELESLKLSKEFLTMGFDDKTVELIVKDYNEKDPIDFIKSLSTRVVTLVENVRKEEQKKFQQNAHLPGGSQGNGGNDIDPVIKGIIDKQKSGNEARKLFGIE